MKIINYIVVLLSFALMCSCDDDKLPHEGATYVAPEAVLATPLNPETGKAYSQAEIDALEFDITKEMHYFTKHNIELVLKTKTKPASVKLIPADGESKDLQISGSGSDYTATLKTTVTELGIKGATTMGVAFEVRYSGSSSSGKSVEYVTYKIKHVVYIPAPVEVFLKDGTNFKLKGDMNMSEFAESPEGKLEATFNGSSNQISIKEDGKLDFMETGDFTVAIWMKSNTVNGDPSIIGNKDWGSGGNPGFVFFARGAKGWKINAGDGSNRIDISGRRMDNDSFTVFDDQWHLLTVTFDRDGMCKLYEDGKMINESDMSGIGSMKNDFNLHIAQDGTGTYSKWYEGKTSSAMIFDYVLTESEIKALKR